MAVVTLSPAIPNAPPPGKYTEDYYVYNPVSFSLAAGAVQPISLAVQADSYFKLIKLTQFSDLALAAQTESTRVLPLVNVQITDTGSGRNLFLNPVPLPALFGDGRIPFILPIVRVFPPSSTIAMSFTNYSAATTYNIQVALHGIKMFPK